MTIKKNSQKVVVLAAGGTGGHIFPAEALAQILKSRGYQLAFITDCNSSSLAGTLAELEFYQIDGGGLVGQSIFLKLRNISKLVFGFFQAKKNLKKLRPNVVVGFGGYASVPTMLAATMAGYRCVIHEQNAVLGTANRFLAKHVDKVATSFIQAQGISHLPKSKIKYTGMPVRKKFNKFRDFPYPPINNKNPLVILILGGSQGARILSKVVPKALGLIEATFRSKVKIVQQCRSEDIEEVKSLYAAQGMIADLATFYNDVPERMAAASLVIARAGASTVAELTMVGRPAILIPYPFAIDRHQQLNAEALERVGACWLMEEDVLTSKKLAKKINILLRSPASLQKAATCARNIGCPSAAAELAGLVSSLSAQKRMF